MKTRLITTLILLTCISCTQRKNFVYRVALQSLPEKIDPRNNDINIFHFINLNLYYPLFEKDDQSRLSSHFLDMERTKSSDNFKQFDLCLKSNIRFTDGSFIAAEHLKSSMQAVHNAVDSFDITLKKLSKVEILGSNCVQVKLTTSDNNYFDELTSVQSTILKEENPANGVPVGLGAYLLKLKTKDKLVLDAWKNGVSGDYKTVEFVRYGDNAKALQEGVIDWNHLYNVKKPAVILEKYQKLIRPTLKSYYIFVRINNDRLRKQFAQCFDRNAFLKAAPISVTPTPGFLPLGLPGASVNFDDVIGKRQPVECKFSNQKMSYIYYNHNLDMDSSIRRFFDTEKELFPFKVDVKTVTTDELIDTCFSSDEMLAIISSDSLEFSSQSHFTSFVGPKRFIREKIKRLEDFIHLALDTSDVKQKEKYFSEAHAIVLRSGYVLPLGQFEFVQFYPPHIDNIRLADRARGYPRIDLMKVKNGIF